MSWFADLAGRAEDLLNNLDEQTGAALRNHNKKPKSEDSEANWNQRRRPLIKGARRISAGDTKPISVSNSPTRRSSPTNQLRKSATAEIRILAPKKKSPTRKTPSTVYNLNHCPKTLVNDVHSETEFQEQYGGMKKRRHSVPSDLDSVNGEVCILRMQNLEVENTMLKNELNVMNKEVSDLLEKLRLTEDGNDVVSEDANKAHAKLDNADLENHRVNLDKEVLASQVEHLKIKLKETNNKKEHYCEMKTRLNKEVMRLTEAKQDFDDKIDELKRQKQELTTEHQKLETDYRHAQSTITELQNNLDKSNEECHRLEKDWEAYKLRVKSMLFAKDNEIKSLQGGLSLTEDTKVLVEQIESLKYERDDLAEAIVTVRNECENFKHHMTQVENRHESTERVVAALREALKDERVNKNRAEAQCNAVSKELKSVQIETGQTIASLRTALRDKENELINLRDSISLVKTPDTSALNVADYSVADTARADSDKMLYLTETLFQRQAKIDRLIGDNNILKIQMDKLESKYKAEVGSLRNSHSVVNLQTENRQRRHGSDSNLQVISNRIAAVVKRYPAFRIFIILYMVCLHFWVLTVLLTNTPENYIPRAMKSSPS